MDKEEPTFILSQCDAPAVTTRRLRNSRSKGEDFRPCEAPHCGNSGEEPVVFPQSLSLQAREEFTRSILTTLEIYRMQKKRNMVRGKIEEIIYARLEPGEDLLRALWDICKQNVVKTGVLLNTTGSMQKVRIMR